MQKSILPSGQTETIHEILRREFHTPDLAVDEPWYERTDDPVAGLAASLALEHLSGSLLPPSLLLVYPDALSLSRFLSSPEPFFTDYHHIRLGTGRKRLLVIQGDPNTGGLDLPRLGKHLPDVAIEVVIEPDMLARRQPLHASRRIRDLLNYLHGQDLGKVDGVAGYCNGGLAALQIANHWCRQGHPPDFCAWLNPHPVARCFTLLDAALQVIEWGGLLEPHQANKLFGRIEYEILHRRGLRGEGISYNQWLLDRRVARHHRALTRRFPYMVQRDQMLSRMVRRCRIPVPDCPVHVWQTDEDLAARELEPPQLAHMTRHRMKGSHNQWDMKDFAVELKPLLMSQLNS